MSMPNINEFAYLVADQESIYQELYKAKDLFTNNPDKEILFYTQKEGKYHIGHIKQDQFFLSEPVKEIAIEQLKNCLPKSTVTEHILKATPLLQPQTNTDSKAQAVSQKAFAQQQPIPATPESLQEQRNSAIQGYYNILPGRPLNAPASMEIGKKHADKNRYLDVLPYDDRRVRDLSDKSFYINASPIIIEKQNYMVTQGPMKNTIEDFWRAVLLTDSKLIVSLENNDKKCIHYWDTKEPLQVGDYTITPAESNFKKQSDIQGQHYETREFTISTKGQKDYTITHLHYIGWPDHQYLHGSVPDKKVFQQFLKYVNTLVPKDNTPITVHCSAGRGRTGVLIAARAIAQKLPQNPKQDFIRDITVQLRQQREQMVQTPEQYQFLFDLAIDQLKEQAQKK